MAKPLYILKIYPYPLTNLQITPTIVDSIRDTGSYYEATVVEDESYTVSADGYQTQTIAEVKDNLTITLVASPKYFSKFSDGTNTYLVKDADARTALVGKQDTLVSGTNIKTVGGTSLLGSGNIALPTINNASLIIQKNGTNVATFTANASSNVTANISVPNTVSSVSSSSTNADAVGAKLFYDTVGAIDDALSAIISGTIMHTLTFNLTGSYKSYLSSLTVNGTTYTYSDFTNNSLALSFPQGTSITWSATSSGATSPIPPSGSLTLNSDSTVTIEIGTSGGGYD